MQTVKGYFTLIKNFVAVVVIVVFVVVLSGKVNEVD